MENASKALIIAGAILISIVLIGVGVLIVGNAQGIFNQGSMQMSQMEIESFNSTFTAFEGKQTGSNVRTLLQKICTNNITYAEDAGKKVNFQDVEITTENVASYKAGASLGTSYTVTCVLDKNTGLVTNITTNPTITPKS